MTRKELVRFLISLAMVGACSAANAQTSRVQLQRDDQASTLTVAVDGREALAYQYGQQYALPHYWPVRSPSGRLLTVQHPEPYPHHRSIWIADKLQVGGRPAVDFYHCWQNYVVEGDPSSGFRHFIRHQDFQQLDSENNTAVVRSTLRWIIDQTTPVIDESRTLRIVALEDGEYLFDLSWELKANDEAATFASDWVHYAWPYVRIHPEFSGEAGGKITDDQGRQGQEATNGKYANWIDYSNTVDGSTEGLAVFIRPTGQSDGQEHKWLTREYGTFGPRRPDAQSGTRFVLQPSESLQGRVGILVHRGDATSGRVAQRYLQYLEDEL